MKYFLLFSALFFIVTHDFLIAMEQEINDIIQNGDTIANSDHENVKKNINKDIVNFVHDLLHIKTKTDASDEKSNNKSSMERALEHLKIKYPKKYKKIKQACNQNSTKSKHKNKDTLSSHETKIIQLCFSMLEAQNNDDQKNYKQERLKKWLSFGWGVVSTAATITVSLYIALNPIKIMCNGTVS